MRNLPHSKRLLGLTLLRKAILVYVIGEVGFAGHAYGQSILHHKLNNGHGLTRRLGLSLFSVVPNGGLFVLEPFKGIFDCAQPCRLAIDKHLTRREDANLYNGFI
ncbi:MAG: hypothetical protein ACXWTP_11620 [Methylosarcina sp.]